MYILLVDIVQLHFVTRTTYNTENFYPNLRRITSQYNKVNNTAHNCKPTLGHLEERYTRKEEAEEQLTVSSLSWGSDVSTCCE